MLEKDWTQLEYLNWFHYTYDNSEWEKFVDFAEKNNLLYKEQNFLRKMAKMAAHSSCPSMKELKWAKSLTDRISQEMKRDEFTKAPKSDQSSDDCRHLTIRLAWHDNKWNGHICKDPENNIYCNGYHSLLSPRIRKRKKPELEAKYPEAPISVFKTQETEPQNKEYIPPCFWSINAFGQNTLEIKHDNPAAPKLVNIEQQLYPHSLFSWPFSLSFCRDKKTSAADGKYPKNLESVRIPNFQNKFTEAKSLVFLYLNYDNPISESDHPGEWPKYAVVGCGFLKKKTAPTRFENPPSEFQSLRKKQNLQNFPNINWALEYTIDYPEDFVRLPYHEYLQDAEKSNNYEKLNRFKVTIDEEELVHCFKYVAMDIDDDEAIYLLTKIRQKLLLIRNDGIIPPENIDNDLEKIDQFLKYCWTKRGYIPGFESLARIFLYEEEEIKFRFSGFINFLKDREGDNFINKLLQILQEPDSDPQYKRFSGTLFDLHEAITERKGLDVKDFVQLCMLNLSRHQLQRIVKGELSESLKLPLREICQNPYLLFEEYESNEDSIDFITGEVIDHDIALYKIDIAFFPNPRYLDRLPIQRKMKTIDQRRVRALIIDYLESLENFGHCFDNAESIENNLRKYPLFYHIDKEYELPDNFLLSMSDDYESHIAKKLELIDKNNTKYIYLKDVYSAEQKVSAVITKLLAKNDHTMPAPQIDGYLEESCAKLENELENFDRELFIEERTELYNNIFKKHLFILTGSPGSGKSSELLNILSMFEKNGEKYILLAPTGKAALRLSNDPKYPGVKSKTIDKFLKDVENRRDNPSLYNNIIVDEMSMVDLTKFRDLLECFGFDNPGLKRLILVGDQYQLPPIGFGKVFSDIIRFIRMHSEYKANIIELESNCRLRDASILNFTKIYSNLNIDYEPLIEKISLGKSDSNDFKIIFWQNRDELFNAIEQSLRTFDGKDQSAKVDEILNRLFNIDFDQNSHELRDRYNLDSFQIISPYRMGISGVISINNLFQNEFKKNIPLLHSNNFTFKHLDKVIQTQNKYQKNELFLSNGSTGLAMRLERTDQISFPDPEEGYKNLSLKDLDNENLEPAFCITIHKAQGSGFDHVFVIMPKRSTILSRELFYTAISRPKKSLTLFIEGSPNEDYQNSIFSTLRNRSYSETRKTTLLGLPIWDFSLSPEKGIFVQSRAEYIIYQKLLHYKEKHSGFNFDYEKYPTVNGKQLKMRTDFTIYTDTGFLYYWEHLGMLGNRYYENKWQFKCRQYEKEEIIENLITTDEFHGISDEKIVQIIENLRAGNVSNEDKYRHYSYHHFSLS